MGPQCLPCSVVRGHRRRIPATVWEALTASIAAPQLLIPRRVVITLRERKPSGVRRDVSRLRRIQILGQGRGCSAEAYRGNTAFLSVHLATRLNLGEVPCECVIVASFISRAISSFSTRAQENVMQGMNGERRLFRFLRKRAECSHGSRVGKLAG